MGKKIGWILLALILGGGAFLLYYWRQATKLPNWYAPTADLSVELKDSKTIDAEKEVLVSRIESEIADQALVDQADPLENQPVEVELTAEEFNTIVSAEPTAQKVLQLTKGFNTTIEDGVLESGFVINLADLPVESLNRQGQAVLQQVMQTLPGLENQDLYIGIEGQPRIEQGQLRWDENTRFKVGGLSLSLNDVAQQLGLSPEQLQQLISLELAELDLSDVELSEQSVLIRGVAE